MSWDVLGWWLSWLEHHPINQKAMDLIPSEGTCLDCGFHSQSGHVGEAPNWYFFLTSMILPLSPSFPLSLTKISISMSSGEDKVNKKTWKLRECNVSSTSLLLGNPWSPQCWLSLSVTCSCLPGCNSSGLLVAAPTLPPWPTPGPLCVLPGTPFPQVSVRGHWADTVVLSVWLSLPVFYLTLLLSIRM